MGDGDTDETTIREELAEIREKQATQGVELKWTKWLAAAAFAASALGQVTAIRPDATAVVLDLLGKLT